MWRALIQPLTLLTRLSTIIDLLREQNSLLREQLRAQGIVAKTPRPSTNPAPPPTPIRPRTAQDLSIVDDESRIIQTIKAFEQTQRPWRTAQEPAIPLDPSTAASPAPNGSTNALTSATGAPVTDSSKNTA